MPVSKTQEQPAATRSATERAEEMLNRVGKRFGTFAVTAGQRVQQTAAVVRERPAQRGQPVSKSTAKSTEPEEETLERADQLVSLMEFRLKRFTASMSRTLQRTTARVREEAEDMWAEAQHIRNQNRRPPR